MESYNMCSWCLVSFTEHTFLRFIYVRACVSFFWRVIFHVWIDHRTVATVFHSGQTPVRLSGWDWDGLCVLSQVKKSMEGVVCTPVLGSEPLRPQVNWDVPLRNPVQAPGPRMCADAPCVTWRAVLGDVWVMLWQLLLHFP